MAEEKENEIKSEGNHKNPYFTEFIIQMNDILTQDEVDALLKGVQTGERQRSSLRIQHTSPWRPVIGKTRSRRRKSLQKARSSWRRTSGDSIESMAYRSWKTNRWRALSKYRSNV